MCNWNVHFPFITLWPVRLILQLLFKPKQQKLFVYCDVCSTFQFLSKHVQYFPAPQMFSIMKHHSANLLSSMKKKADKDEPLEMKE